MILNMTKLTNYFLCLMLVLGSNAAVAQDAAMADTMRSEGKIYVVVAIILTVLAGLITYLFLLDRKVTKLERWLNEKAQTKL
jgi:hypothetical protein